MGGSEAAAACGLDPFRSRVMLWAEKTGRIERPETEAMAWGRLLEPIVIIGLERRGWEVTPAPAEGYRDGERPWMVGHPDAFTTVEGWPAVLEVKTAGPWSRGVRSGELGAPLPYVAQVQHYLALTGYPFGVLAALIGGQRLEVVTVPRDDAAIAALVELEGAFLEFVRSDSPPPPDGSASAAEALSGLYPEAVKGQAIRLDAEALRELRELAARKEQAARVAEQVAELEQRLKARLGEAELAIGPHDEPLARWSSYESRRLDTKALRKALPAIADEYTTTKPHRRLTLE